jgi:hypothetical protein
VENCFSIPTANLVPDPTETAGTSPSRYDAVERPADMVLL